MKYDWGIEKKVESANVEKSETQPPHSLARLAEKNKREGREEYSNHPTSTD